MLPDGRKDEILVGALKLPLVDRLSDRPIFDFSVREEILDRCGAPSLVGAAGSAISVIALTYFF
jgi:hypothetical protein